MIESNRPEPTETNGPEFVALQEMDHANRGFLRKLPEQFPVVERGKSSRVDTDSFSYWGIGVAIALAKNGLSIGFESVSSTGDSKKIGQITGSKKTINHWLTVTGYEHRGSGRSNNADSESRSGLFTMMFHPDEGTVYQHVAALHSGTSIEDVMRTHPRFEDMSGTAAARFDVTDYEGVARMYQEDPEKVRRLFLTRSLPGLGNLRKSIKFSQESLEWEKRNNYVPPVDAEEDLKAMYTPKEKMRVMNFLTRETKYFQKKHDFTVGLLQSGLQPYTLEEAVPLVEEYVAGLFAEHPELSPMNARAQVKDVIADTGRLLKDIHRQDVFDVMRHNPQDN